MKLQNIFTSLIIGSALMTSCSDDLQPDVTSPEMQPSEYPSISFTIGARGTGSRADGEIQTANESKVESLLAVIFTDADGANNTKVITSAEDNTNDLFYEAIDLDVTGITSDTKEYNIKFTECGPYQVCFIANPSETLKTAINGLTKGTSTVNDFKTLVEDDGEPEGKPMLMTSEFFGVNVLQATNIKIGNVELERAMARIDVICESEEQIVITGITFNNRAIKSTLISDAVATIDDHIEATPKSYELPEGGLSYSKENPEKGEYKETIYSYEQYFEEDEKCPSIDIRYEVTAGGEKRTYIHRVDFKEFSEAGDNSLHLKRNNLYTIKISGGKPDGNIILTLTVADWAGGTTFEVSKEQILDGLKPVDFDFDGIKVGDYFLSDGTYMSYKTELTDEEKAKIVGIVASLNPDCIGESARKQLGTPHGLVLATSTNGSDLGVGEFLKVTGQTFDNEYTNLEVQEAMEYGKDGYAMTKMATEAYYANQSEYGISLDVFHCLATNYPEVPEGTTGWYIPSLNEITHAIFDLCGVEIPEINGVEGGYPINNLYEIIAKYPNLNDPNGSMIPVGGEILTTTPYNNSQLYGFGIAYNTSYEIHYYFRNNMTTFWPILAF